MQCEKCHIPITLLKAAEYQGMICFLCESCFIEVKAEERKYESKRENSAQ